MEKIIEKYEIKGLKTKDGEISFSLQNNDMVFINIKKDELEDVFNVVSLNKESNTVTINGNNVDYSNVDELNRIKSNISIIEPKYYPRGTGDFEYGKNVGYNIALPFLSKGNSIDDLKPKILEIIKELNKDGSFQSWQYDKKMVWCDHGEIYKTYIARALLTEPRIIILKNIEDIVSEKVLWRLRIIQQLFNFSIIWLNEYEDYNKKRDTFMYQSNLLSPKEIQPFDTSDKLYFELWEKCSKNNIKISSLDNHLWWKTLSIRSLNNPNGHRELEKIIESIDGLSESELEEKLDLLIKQYK